MSELPTYGSVHDPDFSPKFQGRLKVYLNGVDVTGECIAYDTQMGFVTLYPKVGEDYLNGPDAHAGFITVDAWGTVEVSLKDD